MKPSTYGRFRLKTFALRAGRTFFFLFTVGYGLIEGADFFFASFDRFRLPSMAVCVSVIVIIAVVRGFSAQRQLRELQVQIGTEYDIRIVVDDFMSNVRRFPDASCVFGVNDRFDISGLKPDSVHAAFLKEYFPHNDAVENQAELDRLLKADGLVMPPARVETAVPAAVPGSDTVVHTDVAARLQHPHGTVACLRFGQNRRGDARNAFLLVNSTRSLHGFAGDGGTAGLIRRIWEYHQAQKLTSEQVVFSLVGTGHAHDLSKMNSVLHIIDEYFGQLERPSAEIVRIKRLVISIFPQVVMSAEVNLETVHNYVRARAAMHRALS